MVVLSSLLSVFSVVFSGELVVFIVSAGSAVLGSTSADFSRVGSSVTDHQKWKSFCAVVKHRNSLSS